MSAGGKRAKDEEQSSQGDKSEVVAMIHFARPVCRERIREGKPAPASSKHVSWRLALASLALGRACSGCNH